MSRAAFLTCEDARNYGWNTSVLFTSLVYQRADCDNEFMEIAEQTLARVWATPLTTNDTDEEKVCYFEGIYEGVTDRLSFEYQSCYFDTGEHDLFDCIPIETIALFSANTLMGLYNSIEETSGDDVLAIFDRDLSYAVCKESEEACEETISAVLLESVDADDKFLADLLIEKICNTTKEE
jgi:hypothetical protein